MYNLKGFITYPSLINNDTDQIAKLGEVSDDSLTYAKDKTYHTSVSTPGSGLISFFSKRDATVIDVPATTKDLVLSIAEFILRQANLGAFNANATDCRQLILAEFASSVGTFQVGQMVTNFAFWMPEFFTLTDPALGEDNHTQVWLCNDSFAGQYEDYTIELVHPIIPYDDFFLDPGVVIERLRDYDFEEKLEEVQARRNSHPYTYLRSLPYDYVNPRNPSTRYPARWLALIYGVAGDNSDLINDKIIEQLLASNTHTRAEWEQILPDLFKKTEFIITPFSNSYSVPAGLLESGFYSPTVDPRKTLALTRRTARGPGYNQVWVDNNYELSSNTYKSVAFSVVGNSNNRAGATSFKTLFPDYMLVTNDTDDFDRMSPNTGEWVAMFWRLLRAADTMSQFSTVPLGVSRMIRDGVVYATAMHNRINYLVVAKSSVVEFG